MINLSHTHPGVEIECEQGTVWVTSAGDINDYTLEAGDSFIARDSSAVVVEAVEDAIVNLKDADREFAVHIAV